MTREEFEQIELDTRDNLELAISYIAEKAVEDTKNLIEKNYQVMAERNMHIPRMAYNRHEAYGVAAEQQVRIEKAVKDIKSSIAGLLKTLSNSNLLAVEAVGTIYSTALKGAYVMIKAAAEMRRTMENLYTTEANPQNTSLMPLEKEYEPGGEYFSTENNESKEGNEEETGEDEDEDPDEYEDDPDDPEEPESYSINDWYDEETEE